MSQQQSFGGTAIPGAADIQFAKGNDGVLVPPNPATHVWNIVGNTTQGVSVSGNAGTFTSTITVASATTSQLGVAQLATNAQTIAGTSTTVVNTPASLAAKLGTQTLHGLAVGAGTTAAVMWLAEAANGQLPIGSTGHPPVLANITSADGSVTVTNGPGTIDLSVSGDFFGTGTTIGAVTSNIISIPLGGVSASFQLEARVKAFESTGPSAAGYNLFGTFITDGTTARLVGNQDIFNEDSPLTMADAYFFATGADNNAYIQVLGVAGLTINWTASAEKT